MDVLVERSRRVEHPIHLGHIPGIPTADGAIKRLCVGKHPRH